MALAHPPGESQTQNKRLATQGSSKKTATFAVIIVNFCQWNNTLRLVSQIRRSVTFRNGEAEIIVVDNHSPRHSAAEKLKLMKNVRLVMNESNQGFSVAVNAGASQLKADWIVLLNPDVSVEDGFLDELNRVIVQTRRQDVNASVIGLQMRDTGGALQASTGSFPSFSSTLLGLFRSRANRKGRPISTPGRIPVEWVTGGCLIARRECFETLSGLDERYFLYYEDVDFCQRVRQLGKTVWYDPSVSVTHHSPLHGREVPAPLRLITRHALISYAQRHWPQWQTFCLRRIIRWESQVHRLSARFRGDHDAARCYLALERMTRKRELSPIQITEWSELLRKLAAKHDRVK